MNLKDLHPVRCLWFAPVDYMSGGTLTYRAKERMEATLLQGYRVAMELPIGMDTLVVLEHMPTENQ